MFGLFDDMFGDSYNGYGNYYGVPSRYYGRPQQRRPQTARYPQYWEDDESDSESEVPQPVFETPRSRRAQPAKQVQFRPSTVQQSRAPEPRQAPKKVEFTEPKPVQPATQKQQEVVTDSPSDDVLPAQQQKPKITNREANDAPEVAFKTYDPRNTIADIAQKLKPLDELAQKHMSVDRDGATILIPKSEAVDVPRLTATRAGVIELSYGAGDQTVVLRYQLPAYYERSEIQAAETKDAFVVRVPLYCSPAEDVLRILFR